MPRTEAWGNKPGYRLVMSGISSGTYASLMISLGRQLTIRPPLTRSFLILDFDLIEQGEARGFPKYMEWFAAFSVLVTLIWLYMEVFKLVLKLLRRR